MYGENDILDVLKSVIRSVVHTNTVKVLHDYYHHTLPVKGSISGFILEPDGHVVTNDHIVRQVEKIGIVLWDNELIQGAVLGACRNIDIVVVKKESEGMSAAGLGDSDRLRMGPRI